MDPITALCLSVPPSLALVIATRLVRHQLTDAARQLGYALKDGALASATRLADALDRSASELADAHVRAARYHAGAITVRPRAPEKPEPTLYQHWLDGGGATKSEAIQNRVDWAILRVLGEESDEQGSLEKAAEILTRDAPGFLVAATQERERRAKAGK